MAPPQNLYSDKFGGSVTNAFLKWTKNAMKPLWMQIFSVTSAMVGKKKVGKKQGISNSQ
jgi:hypothetical protein